MTENAQNSKMKYSQKEQQLINALHFGDFLNQEPATTYRTLALHCFAKGIQGSLSESVRKCYNAMVNSYPYRLTQEFDDLIEFPNEPEYEYFHISYRKDAPF
jgi:hypothetical protein